MCCPSLNSTPRKKCSKPFSQVRQFNIYVRIASRDLMCIFVSTIGFTTLDNRDAAWVDPATKTPYRIVTKDGPCRPKTLVGASLS